MKPTASSEGKPPVRQEGHTSTRGSLQVSRQDPKAAHDERLGELWAAVALGQVDAVEELLTLSNAAEEGLRAGCSANPRDYDKSALMYAADNGQMDSIRLILRHQAYVNDVDAFQCTALIYAVHQGHRDIIEVLVSAGAKLEAAEKHQWTPLMFAVSYGHLDIAKLLVDSLADVNAALKNRWSVLMMAVQTGREDIVRFLLDHGADTNVVSHRGDTALSIAAENGYSEIVELLLRKTRNVSVVDCNGNTPMMRAAMYGHVAIVERLLECGAVVAIYNQDGLTAIDFTIELGHLEVAVKLKAAWPPPIIDVRREDKEEEVVSLDQIEALCDTMHEARAMCKHVHSRLLFLYDQLELVGTEKQESIGKSYTSILQRFHAFLALYGNSHVITRLVSGQAIVDGCRQLHVSLSHEIHLCDPNSHKEALEWEQKLEDDSKAQLGLLKSVFERNQIWERELHDPEAQAEALTLLMFELNQRKEKYSPDELHLIERICESVAQFSKLGIPSIPKWFIPTHEVQFNPRTSFNRGAYGSVHLGTWIGTVVVVKSIYGVDRESRRMFLNEADIWSDLQHPHIVKLFGACHIGNPFFVCEYASQGTLADFVYRQENRHRTWKCLHEAALGLCYLHTKRKVVHRDLKCDNILIGQDGLAKLADFGLSYKEVDLPSDDDASGVGATRWKAPECLSGECSGSFASDVYSFGMVIIEAVTRSLPWGMTMPDVAVKYKVCKKQKLPKQPAAISDVQWQFIKRMCSPKPLDRIDMNTVVEELAKLSRVELESKRSQDRQASETLT